MKSRPKKLLSLLMSGFMAVSSLTFSYITAFAESSIGTVETKASDQLVNASGALGTFVSDEMKKAEAEDSEAQQSDYMITNVNYDSERGIIDIDYSSITNCKVFVGLYNDEGTELYTSATQNVQASESGHVQMTIDASLYEHYLIILGAIAKYP